MATRSTISLLDENGKPVKKVYCHNDGYPSHQLKTLKKFYNTTEKVEELLALGDLSFLSNRVKPNPGEVHTFDNPNYDITVAYHRDRGEDLATNYEGSEDFNYGFDGKNWIILDR